MTLMYLGIAFAIGVILAFVPLTKSMIQYFDTIVHEVGHGLATLPFGANLPKIKLNKDFSGETRSSLGQIHNVFPAGIGIITAKVARFFSLIAGYSAPLILGSFLLVLSYLSISSRFFEVNEWVILSLGLIALSTLLWTIVAAVDSPIIFFLASAAVVALGWIMFDMGLYSLWLVLAMAVAFLLGKFVLSFVALAVTIISGISTIFMFTGASWMFGSSSPELEEFLSKIFLNQSFDPSLIALIVFSAIGLVAFLSSRNFFSLFVVIAIMTSIIGSTVFSMILNNNFAHQGLMLEGSPLIATPFLLSFIAGTLFASGIKSFAELGKLTFSKGSQWRTDIPNILGVQSETGTDVVFATDELGGTKEFWFVVLAVITVIVSGWILTIPFDLFA